MASGQAILCLYTDRNRPWIHRPVHSQSWWHCRHLEGTSWSCRSQHRLFSCLSKITPAYCRTILVPVKKSRQMSRLNCILSKHNPREGNTVTYFSSDTHQKQTYLSIGCLLLEILKWCKGEQFHIFQTNFRMSSMCFPYHKTRKNQFYPFPLRVLFYVRIDLHWNQC